ncbi:MAG: uracil-DNA glycosylase, partial [Propionibacteriaceae bacterium]|nr:uracil-DNA glycosylase [Propionibacteriaceae bacterium]
PLVAILWGKDAQTLIPRLGTIPYIASAHPSPMSSHAGFYGSRPFSKTNQLLEELSSKPIVWA